MLLFLVAGLIIVILAVIFALQNTIPITVTFLTWKFESSLAFVLLLALILGVILSLITLIPSLIRKNWTISKQRKKITELEKDLQKLAKPLPAGGEEKNVS